MGSTIRKPIIYLTNKELLAEIARCKASFCYFTDDEYSKPDAYVTDLAEITPEWLDETCKRLSKERSRKSDPVTVEADGLIIRHMTYDHIPLDPNRPKKARAINQTHALVNFPPFRHYRLSVAPEGTTSLTEVGRSHWEGGLENGWFNAEKGRVTNRMGRMYQELVERYGRKGNFRGYSYNDEMQSLALLQLCQVGLQFDESKSSNPFAYFSTVVTNCFVRVLNLEKKAQALRDDLLEIAGAAPSMTRQIEAEMGKAPAPPKRKPGRPKKVVPA